MSSCKVGRAQDSQSLHPDLAGRGEVDESTQNLHFPKNHVHERAANTGNSLELLSDEDDSLTQTGKAKLVLPDESLKNRADQDRRDRVLRSAFECRQELVAYARVLLGNYSAAEDAVQEAMLVVVAKHDQFEEGTSILAWCRSIVRIEVLRSKQQQQRERSLAQKILDDAVDSAFEAFQTSPSPQELEVRRDALALCVEQISERSKKMLEARFVDELGYPQIGRRLSMSIEAVRKALFRVKKQVRSCVETRLRTAQ